MDIQYFSIFSPMSESSGELTTSKNTKNLYFLLSITFHHWCLHHFLLQFGNMAVTFSTAVVATFDSYAAFVSFCSCMVLSDMDTFVNRDFWSYVLLLPFLRDWIGIFFTVFECCLICDVYGSCTRRKLLSKLCTMTAIGLCLNSHPSITETFSIWRHRWMDNGVDTVKNIYTDALKREQWK